VQNIHFVHCEEALGSLDEQSLEEGEAGEEVLFVHDLSQIVVLELHDAV